MAISARARELRAEGRDVYSFGAGEPDFPTPEHIVAAAQEAAANPAHHRYTSNTGLEELRESIAGYTKRYSGVDVAPSQIVVTNGAKQAIFESFAALIDPGDEVLLPAPHWVTYPAGIELAGGLPISIETDMASGFKVTPDDLEKARTPRTKLLVFVSPSNPTGAIYSHDEARAIGQWAMDNDVWIVADEIYQRLAYGNETVAPSIADATDGLENVVLVNGVAKSFAMTGWRVGWLIGPEDVASAAARFQSHATSNVNNVAQMAALAALEGPQDTVEEMRRAFDRRRREMYQRLSGHPQLRCIEPQGAFYAFPNVEALLSEASPTSSALAKKLIEEAGVAVVPGESFGAPGHLRLSYALADEDMSRGLDAMFALFERL